MERFKIVKLLNTSYVTINIGGDLMPKEEKKEEVKEEKLGEEIGKVTHYFTKIGVAVIELGGDLKVGDKIHIKGATSDFKQKVKSMQIEHEEIEEAEAGQSIGLKVEEHAREGDKVYKVTE